MTGERGSDSPGVIAFPPLIFGGTLAIGLVAHFLYPIRPFPAMTSRVLGAVLLVGSAVVAKWGESTMHRAGTNVRPDRPATAVVVDGPFRYTRNPLYLATTGLYVAISLLVDALWPLVLLVPLLAIVEWGVIRREERYLEAKFGDTYRAYRSRVRRWL